jgi:ABC-2 type transport system permease protein
MSTSPTAGNLTAHAIRVGITRGWIEFRNSLRSPQDIGFYVFFGGAALAYLLFNRDNIIEGTDIALATVTLPSIIGALVIFGAYVGPMFQLAIEREDGTLLRAKALPRGMTGYVTGQVLAVDGGLSLI